MAEIKLNDSFKAEVEAFRASGVELDNVNAYSVSTTELSLPTVDAYQERLSKICKLCFEFSVLKKKDAADMDDLAARLKAADTIRC